MLRESNLHAVVSFFFMLTSLVRCLPGLSAEPRKEFSLANQSTPEIRVRVYGFPGLTRYAIQGAEAEATRILRTAQIDVIWVDCSFQAASRCGTLPDLADVIVRILPKALPRADSTVLGIAGPTGSYPAAFIFFDRVMGLRTHTRLVPAILGRVMVHEITHLLLPKEGHSNSGLMRGRWTADNFDLIGGIFLGLSPRSFELLRREACIPQNRRRVDGKPERDEVSNRIIGRMQLERSSCGL
jgi:hypothetical protein